MGEQVRQRVGKRRRIPHARIAQPRKLLAQPAPARLARRGQVQVHVLGQRRDALREPRVARLLRLARHVRRRNGQIARGVAHHRVAGLEPLDALLLRLGHREVDVHVRAQAVGELGDALGGGGQILLEPGHARDEGGQRVEVGERVGAHPRDLDAPGRGQALDLAHLVDGGAVGGAALAGGHPVQGPGRREQERGDRDAENQGAGLHEAALLAPPPSRRSSRISSEVLPGSAGVPPATGRRLGLVCERSGNDGRGGGCRRPSRGSEKQGAHVIHHRSS